MANDNGMGGRRIGKKSHETFYNDNPDGSPRSKNYEQDTDWYSAPNHGRMTDLEKLIADYNRDNSYIRSLKRKWLPPKPRKPRRNEKRRT